MTTSRSEGRSNWRGRVQALSRWSLVLLLALGSLLAVARPAVAVAEGRVPATAAAAPETAVAFVSVNLDRTSGQWRNAEELLGRAGFPNAIAEFERHVLAGGHADGDVTQADLDALLGGELAIVVTAPAVSRLIDQAMPTTSGEPAATPAPGEGHGIAAILLPGDPDAAWSAVQQRLDHLAQDGGTQVERLTYGGQTILSVAATDDSSPGIAPARLDDFILAAAAPADLEPLIDAATGAAPSLAGFAPLGDVRADLPDESLLFAFANGKGLADAVGTEVLDEFKNVMPQMATPVAGEDDSYQGVALWADDPGFRLDWIANAPPGVDLARLLPANATVTHDERVPADALLFAGGTFPEGAWNGLAISAAQIVNQTFAQGTPVPTPTSIREQLSPAYVQRQLADAARVLGFDLRTGLFDQLTGEFAYAFSAPTLMTGGTDLSGIFAVGVKDAATVSGSVPRIARLIELSGAAPDVASRQVDGDTVYVVRDPQNPAMPAIEFGVVGDRLLAGVGTGVDDFLNAPAASLADDEQYQRVLATLPSDYYQVTYVNLARIIPLVMMTRAMSGEMGEAAAAAASPAATPVAAGGPEAITAFAALSFVRDGTIGQSAILYIAEPGR